MIGEYSVKIFNDIEEINYDFESQFELVEPTTPPDKNRRCGGDGKYILG